MLDPRPRGRLPTADPSSQCCGHIHLFKEEIWNQAITLEEVPSPKLTHFVTLLTSHKKGRNFGTLELTLELFSFKFPVVCF